MDFGVLGHISVVRADETPVSLASVPQRRLVGFLISRAGMITSVGNLGLHLGLTDGAVRTGIARLRRRLGPDSDLVTEGPGYMLASDRIDAVAFTRSVNAALTTGADDAAMRATLERALELWRGDAYAEFAHEEWASAEAARLEELRAAATEALVDVLLAHGDHELALDHLSSLIERHPYRDRPRGQRMRALAATGRVTEALRSFHDYRALLCDEVGTLPSPALVTLDQQIATGEDPPAGTRRPAPSAARPTAQRTPRNQAFGLDDVALRVVADIAAGQLVTLTGLGGIGKTRLALAVAEMLAADFDRVVLVDLRLASSTETVLVVAARALGVGATDVRTLVAEVQRARTLLVFDNCEPVAGEAASLIEAILTGAPDCRVLATSRQPLDVAGEHVGRVRPLAASDAAALFADRAARWRDVAIGDQPDDEARITEICERLDGIPLAIELAAACVAHMTLGEIAARIDDRLTVLPGDPTRPQPQRTLRATLDGSYDLLDPDAQCLLRALAVFAGDFDAAAASAVHGRPLAVTLAALGTLVRASLVVARPEGGSTHYELLETVRLHAEEKAVALDELDQLRQHHADHYAAALMAIADVDLLELWPPSRHDTANHDRMLEWVDAHDDRARLGQLAWRTAMAHRDAPWTDATGRYLGREDIAGALSEDERPYYYAASFENANVLGWWDDQVRLADLGLETAAGPVRVALLRGAASGCSVVAPDRVDALVDEALGLAEPDDVDVRVELRRTRVDRMLLEGDLAEAVAQLRTLWEEIAPAWRCQPHPGHPARPLAAIDLLWVDLVLGADEEAAELADALCALPGGGIAGHCGRAVVAARQRRVAQSAHHLVIAAELAKAQAVPLVDNDVIVAAAVRALELGDAERACRLLGSIATGLRSPGALQLYRHARDCVRERLDLPTINRLRAEARRDGPSEITATELTRLRIEAADLEPQSLDGNDAR